MRSLDELEFQLNSIADVVALALAHFRVHPTLRHINLSDAEIQNVGATAMLRAADEQGVVERCILRGNVLQQTQLPELQRQCSVVLGGTQLV